MDSGSDLREGVFVGLGEREAGVEYTGYIAYKYEITED